MSFLKKNSSTFIDKVLSCLHSRLKHCTDTRDVLSCALKILTAHGWEKVPDISFGYDAIQSLSTRFSATLHEAQVNSTHQQEWDYVVLYAKQYIDLVSNSYKLVWWKTFNCPDTKKWSNILGLVELLFTIPISNGHVERLLFQLKLHMYQK